jgi:hypothetical protein
MGGAPGGPGGFGGAGGPTFHFGGDPFNLFERMFGSRGFSGMGGMSGMSGYDDDDDMGGFNFGPGGGMLCDTCIEAAMM